MRHYLAASMVAVSLLVSACTSPNTNHYPRPITKDDRTTTQIALDDALTARVKAKLASDVRARIFPIHVETSHNVVTLSGNVENRIEGQRAAMIAQSVKGVKSVVSQLQVTPRS